MEVTAKEKAIILRDKFYNTCLENNCKNHDSDGCNDYDHTLSSAKDLAILCVDEILKAKPFYPNDKLLLVHIEIGFNQAAIFWQQVKLELLNL